MRTSQVKGGVILSYLQMALHIVLGLVYTPIILRLLGQSEYGLYNTVSSTIATLSMLSLGFGSSYIRYFSRYKKDNDYKQISKLNGLFLLIFLIIGLIAAVCGLYLSFNLKLVFDTGLTEAELSKARVLMLLLTFNLAMGFPMSVFGSIISAHERFLFQKTVSIIQTIFTPCLTIPMLLLGYGSIGLVSISVAWAILSWLICVYYCLVKLKIRFSFKRLNILLFKDMFIYSAFIAINMVVDQINWNIDKILLGRFRGTLEVAVYSLGFSLYSYYQLFSTSISNVFTPRIHKIVNDTNSDVNLQREKLTDLFVRVGRLQTIVLGLIFTGIVFFGKQFITKYWASGEYVDSYFVVLLLAGSGSIALIQNIGIEVQRAQNKHQFRSLVYVGMAIFNLMLSIILCQKYGAIGSAVGTALSLVLANGLVMNIYYHKKCNINILHFWKQILRLSLGFLIPCLCGCLIMKLVNTSDLFSYGGSILAYIMIYAVSMWTVGMNGYEKKLITNMIKSILLK